MQFQVPQNIDLEDKIVGSLSLRSFLTLLFGGMFIYVMFFTLPRALAVIIGVPVGIALIAVSFIKVQDQPFSKFFVSLVYFWLRPRQRVWDQNEPKPQIKINDKKVSTAPATNQRQALSAHEIEKLAAIVDTKGWKPISSDTVEGERIDLEGRVKSSDATALPQSKIESKDAGDVLEVPKL
jgi:hypothetical protein